MVKVNLGLQVKVGTTDHDAVSAWCELVQAQLAALAQVTTDVEVYDVTDAYTELRVWVDADPYAMHLVAPLCQLVSAGHAMFVQLMTCTPDDVASFKLACASHGVDVDMHHDGDNAQGIAYPYTAQQLQSVMGALR